MAEIWKQNLSQNRGEVEEHKRNLERNNPKAYTTILRRNVGTVSPLLLLLSTRHKSVQENAIDALLKLVKHNNDEEVIMENGGLKPIGR
ncbi:hypothetical protein K1719_046759 [Acacia pycnantha]|nr:hypothetical protein K1719_046759 [Acacia pycnantha]